MIVAGVTATAGAAAALHAASGLAATFDDAHVVIAHATPGPPDARTEAGIHAWIRREIGTGREVDASIEWLTGEPVDALLDCADRHDAMLVAVGTHREVHSWPRHRIGHTVATLLRHAERPVMICPPSGGPASYRKLLLGFDDTPASHAALTFARRLADLVNGSVQAVTVVDFEPLTESATSAQHQIAVAEDLALERLAAAVADSPGQAHVTTNTRYGRPHATLLELTDSADLLILGNKHRGHLAQAVLESTVRGCVLRATKPLIAVPQTTPPAKPRSNSDRNRS